MDVFQSLDDSEHRRPDAFPQVVLQERQTKSPLCGTHRLHRLRVALSHRTLQPLIQFAYLFQTSLWSINNTV